MTFTAHLTVVEAVLNPDHEQHYRTTLPPVEGPGAPEGFVAYVELSKPWQASHEHFFSDLTRFGDGMCLACGAPSWSRAWVARGVFGGNTAAWADEREANYRDRVDIEAVARLAEILGAEVIHKEAIVASIDGRERAGIPVPSMNPITGQPIEPSYSCSDHHECSPGKRNCEQYVPMSEYAQTLADYDAKYDV